MIQTAAPELSRRKRILFVVTKSVLGGAQRYVLDLAAGLPRDTYDVAVAFGGDGTPGSPPGILSEMLLGAGVRTIHIPELGRNIDIRGDRAAYQALRALFAEEQPDIVHLNSSKVGGLGALAAKRARVPRIIYTAHGWPFTERVSLISRTIRFLLSWITVLLSDAVICVSESDLRSMQRAPFARRKLVVIHNGIRQVSLLAREEARATLFSKEDIAAHEHDLWLVSVAELTPNKNLFRAIDAVGIANRDSGVPRIFYSIIGAGEQRAALEAYITKGKQDRYVRLLGLVPESRRYLPGFDAVLFASIKEGLPYAILEAGLAGLPVVASATGGIPEIIAHNDTGLLIRNPESVADIAAEISSLRDNEDRALLGAALRSRVEDAFSFEQMRAKTFALYER